MKNNIKMLFLPLLFLLALPFTARAQGPATPDCQIGPTTFTVGGRSVPFDNRTAGCTNWHILYYGPLTGFIGIQIDQAADVGGSQGAWAIWPAADVGALSALPMTSLTGDQASVFEFFPWVSVNVTSFSAGSGTYIAFGYRPRFGMDIGGPPFVDPCQTPGIAKSSFPITFTTATTTQLVAAVAGKVVYACGASFTIAPSAVTADTFSFIAGTGAACVAAQVTLTGSYGNGDLTTAAPVVPVSIISSGTVFSSAIGSGVCGLTTGTSVSVNGILSYVQQ